MPAATRYVLRPFLYSESSEHHAAETPLQPQMTPSGVLVPIPHQDVPLSPEAVAALASAGDLATISVDKLRNALQIAPGRSLTVRNCDSFEFNRIHYSTASRSKKLTAAITSEESRQNKLAFSLTRKSY
jgi:hypothetical protein